MALLKALLFAAGAVGHVSSSCDSNPQPDLDRTFRGVLVGGGWRTSAECDGMSQDDKRNTVIVSVSDRSSRDENYYQGKFDMCPIGAYMCHRGRLGWSGTCGLRQNWGTCTH